MLKKLNPLQVCFGISILFHLLVVGVGIYGGYGTRPPQLPLPEPVIAFTLMAAPDEIVVKPAKPATRIPQLPTVEPIRMVEPVVPNNRVDDSVKIKTVEPVPVVPVIQTTPPAKKVTGDGSSPKPGLDMTTTPAVPLVKAQPEYMINPDPPYPAAALRRHQEGLVLLTVKISELGRAEYVAVKKSSGYPILDEAALAAVRDWKFQPAKLGFMAIESEIEVPVRFEIKE